MLRGKLNAAREKFKEAFEHEPDNPTVQNNINLLNGSYQIHRARASGADAVERIRFATLSPLHAALPLRVIVLSVVCPPCGDDPAAQRARI